MVTNLGTFHGLAINRESNGKWSNHSRDPKTVEQALKKMEGADLSNGQQLLVAIDKNRNAHISTFGKFDECIEVLNKMYGPTPRDNNGNTNAWETLRNSHQVTTENGEVVCIVSYAELQRALRQEAATVAA